MLFTSIVYNAGVYLSIATSILSINHKPARTAFKDLPPTAQDNLFWNHFSALTADQRYQISRYGLPDQCSCLQPSYTFISHY